MVAVTGTGFQVVEALSSPELFFIFIFQVLAPPLPGN